MTHRQCVLNPPYSEDARASPVLEMTWGPHPYTLASQQTAPKLGEEKWFVVLGRHSPLGQTFPAAIHLALRN